jgi:hypothetical protein
MYYIALPILHCLGKERNNIMILTIETFGIDSLF